MSGFASYEIGRADALGRFGSGCPTVRPPAIGRGRVVRLLAAPASLAGRGATAWGGRAVAVSLPDPLREPAQGDHRRLGEGSAPKHVADAVCVGAKHLNDIRVAHALMPQNMCGNGIFQCETLSLYCDIVQLDPVRVSQNCHGFAPLGNMVRRLCWGLRIGKAALVRAAALLSGSGSEDPRPRIEQYHRNGIAAQGLHFGQPQHFVLDRYFPARGGA